MIGFMDAAVERTREAPGPRKLDNTPTELFTLLKNCIIKQWQPGGAKEMYSAKKALKEKKIFVFLSKRRGQEKLLTQNGRRLGGTQDKNSKRKTTHTVTTQEPIAMETQEEMSHTNYCISSRRK